MKIITIGRDPCKNDIVIPDPTVGRIHCQITYADTGEVSIKDLGSVNGTFINGLRIDDTQYLEPGDEVMIGRSTLPWESFLSLRIITIGRADDNDEVLPDEMASRYHCKIIRNDCNEYQLVDLRSTNGTFVNGQRINNIVNLSTNDFIRIGNTILPWQSYFSNPSKSIIPPQHDTKKTPQTSPRARTHTHPQLSSKIVIILVIIAIILIIWFLS